MTRVEDRSLSEPTPGPEWQQINAEEAADEVRFARSMSMAERVVYGQRLSQQAVALLAASVKAGHAPERALWS